MIGICPLQSCLKLLQQKKIRFHVTGYYQDEYILATKQRPHDEL